MIQEVVVENIGEPWKIVYRTEKKEYSHFYKKTDWKPRGILIK